MQRRPLLHSSGGTDEREFTSRDRRTSLRRLYRHIYKQTMDGFYYPDRRDRHLLIRYLDRPKNQDKLEKNARVENKIRESGLENLIFLFFFLRSSEIMWYVVILKLSSSVPIYGATGSFSTLLNEEFRLF